MLEIEVLYGIGIAVYMAAMLVVGYYTTKVARTAEEYIVAGRRMPIWLCTATLFATWFGGCTVLGGAGTAYTEGIWNTETAWGVIPDPFGAGLCLMLAGLFYMHKLRRMKLLTLADFYLVRYGKITQTVASLLILPTFLFWLAVQFIAFGKVLEGVLGWSYEWSIITSVIVTCAYTVMGGLWAVALTDFIQMLILIAGTAIALVYALPIAGGLEAIPAEKLQFFPTEYTFNAWLAWVAAWVTIGLGSLATPDLMQRALGGKDEKTVRLSAVISGLMYWTVGLLPVFLGLLGIVLVEKGLIPAEPLEQDPELLFPLFIKHVMPPAVGVVVVGGLLAAIMSSADSALLAPATILAKNIVRDIFKPGMSDRGLVLASRLGVILLTVLSLVIGLVYPYVYELNVFSFDLILAALFTPLTLGLYWRKTNELGAIAGMMSGIAFRVIAAGLVEGFTFEGVTYPYTWYYYTIGSPVVATLVTIVVSLATQRVNPPRQVVV